MNANFETKELLALALLVYGLSYLLNVIAFVQMTITGLNKREELLPLYKRLMTYKSH